MKADHLPEVEVSVVIIRKGEHMLAVWNNRWGAFTLPMTKRRTSLDRRLKQVKVEPAERAACRAAAEVLGIAFSKSEAPKRIDHLYDLRQSDATGEVKSYAFEIFLLDVAEACQPCPGVISQWMRPQDFRDKEPVSDSARAILRETKLPK